jgi:hypothetical protein
MVITYLARSMFVALVATLGDYVWYEFDVRHTPLHGVLHGAALLLAVGLVLGQQTGRWMRGVVGGVIAGVSGAVVFYVVVAPLGYLGGLIAAWLFMWMVLAFASAWVRGYPEDLPRWVPPGLIAAIGSGATFYLVSGIWTTHPAARNYLWHLLAWTLAWAPGITALTWSRRDT